ncbi:MAG: transmembrane anchor protein [Candidatus Marinimicrobia bacterium]|nr:transmembrane anchor protein [Candidatus Neomarinimicrobiota bacterium]
MFNVQQPTEKDLPTSSQLLKSTIIAILVTCILLLIVIFPAEYGTDPTGVGNLLGLKEMGDIKMSLLDEAQNEPADEINVPSSNIDHKDKIVVNNDVVEHTLEPGQAIEIKLEMKRESLVQYEWKTSKGGLNYNLHGDGYKGTDNFMSYKKGRMVSSDNGDLKAAFDGYHGWFWRNREDYPVTVRLETSGDYIRIKQML